MLFATCFVIILMTIFSRNTFGDIAGRGVGYRRIVCRSNVMLLLLFVFFTWE